MTNEPIYHCVYRITNIVEKRHYYGKHSSKIEPKLDIDIPRTAATRQKISETKKNKSPEEKAIIRHNMSIAQTSRSSEEKAATRTKRNNVRLTQLLVNESSSNSTPELH